MSQEYGGWLGGKVVSQLTMREPLCRMLLACTLAEFHADQKLAGGGRLRAAAKRRRAVYACLAGFVVSMVLYASAGACACACIGIVQHAHPSTHAWCELKNRRVWLAL